MVITEASVHVDGDVVVDAELADGGNVVNAAVGELRRGAHEHAGAAGDLPAHRLDVHALRHGVDGHVLDDDVQQVGGLVERGVRGHRAKLGGDDYV